jgi:antitoxin component YwqK of YwqJK toxin-antitoxin module
MKRNNRSKRLSLFLLCLLCACHPTKPEEDLVLIQIQDRNGLSETISTPDRLVTFSKVDFLTSQPYKKVLRVYRKEGKNRSIITTYHPNGTTWQMLEAKEMRAFGAFREWFASGRKKIEATLIGGGADLTPGAQESWLFDGPASVWDEEGHLIASMLYEKGSLMGNSVYYYPSGVVEKEIPYANDHIEGEAREFWEEGQIKTKTVYRGGLKEGDSLCFWPDGSLCWEEKYAEGRLKTGRYWSLSKELVSEVNEGTGFQAGFQKQRLAQLQEIRSGIVEGQIKTFDASGDLHSIFYLKNGKKQGEEIEYYPKRETSRLVPKISINWDQDAMHGLVKTWYENGQMQSQRELCRNQQNGTACSWYSDGSIMLMEEYENDQLMRGQYYRKNQREPVSSIFNGTGVATLYDEEGIFLRKVTYSKGKIVDPE